MISFNNHIDLDRLTIKVNLMSYQKYNSLTSETQEREVNHKSIVREVPYPPLPNLECFKNVFQQFRPLGANVREKSKKKNQPN
jgi:hypothetical protein